MNTIWMGIQCNNRDAMNSLALDTNNLFGAVRMLLALLFSNNLSRIGLVSILLVTHCTLTVLIISIFNVCALFSENVP